MYITVILQGIMMLGVPAPVMCAPAPQQQFEEQAARQQQEQVVRQQESEEQEARQQREQVARQQQVQLATAENKLALYRDIPRWIQDEVSLGRGVCSVQTGGLPTV